MDIRAYIQDLFKYIESFEKGAAGFETEAFLQTYNGIYAVFQALREQRDKAVKVDEYFYDWIRQAPLTGSCRESECSYQTGRCCPLARCRATIRFTRRCTWLTHLRDPVRRPWNWSSRPSRSRSLSSSCRSMLTRHGSLTGNGCWSIRSRIRSCHRAPRGGSAKPPDARNRSANQALHRRATPARRSAIRESRRSRQP